MAALGCGEVRCGEAGSGAWAVGTQMHGWLLALIVVRTLPVQVNELVMSGRHGLGYRAGRPVWPPLDDAMWG